MFVLLAAGAARGAESAARKKLTLIEDDEAPPGWVTFTAEDVNVLAVEELAEEALQGVTQPVVVLGNNRATASARIDFARVRESSTGETPGALARLLLGGEKDVSVEAAFRSGQGKCEIEVLRVVISGFEIKGRLLDWLIESYLLPLYPTAKVGRPFEMGHRIDRMEMTPARVRFLIVAGPLAKTPA